MHLVVSVCVSIAVSVTVVSAVSGSVAEALIQSLQGLSIARLGPGLLRKSICEEDHSAVQDTGGQEQAEEVSQPT